MTALIRAELLQLRTLRSTYLMPIAALLLTVLITAAAMGDAGTPGMTTVDQLREPLVLGAGLMGAIFLACFAVTQVAGEYRYATIDQRLMASPRRGRVMLAKLAAHGSLAVTLTVPAFAIALAIALPMAASKHVSLGLTLGSTMVLGATVLLATVAFATLGVLTAFICRSQAAGIVVIFGSFLAEKLVGAFAGNVSAYFPWALVSSLLRVGGTLPRGVAAAALIGLTAAVGVAAAVLVARRDVG
jgi:ABC-2 type transport system permease protein